MPECDKTIKTSINSNIREVSKPVRQIYATTTLIRTGGLFKSVRELQNAFRNDGLVVLNCGRAEGTVPWFALPTVFVEIV